VQLVDWTHTMNSGNGSLTRSMTNVRTFQVTSVSSAAQSCAG
jgi:hypothetical protein